MNVGYFVVVLFSITFIFIVCKMIRDLMNITPKSYRILIKRGHGCADSYRAQKRILGFFWDDLFADVYGDPKEYATLHRAEEAIECDKINRSRSHTKWRTHSFK